MTIGNHVAEENLLTTSEAAEMLRVKPDTMKIWRHRGVGPAFVRMGSGRTSPVVYRLSDIREWITARRFVSTSQETAQREAAGA